MDIWIYLVRVGMLLSMFVLLLFLIYWIFIYPVILFLFLWFVVFFSIITGE